MQLSSRDLQQSSFYMDPDIKCPFCRVPYPSSGEEMVERIKKRAEMDDANAIFAT